VLAFYYCHETAEINQLIRRKDLFWLTVLEVSVHGCLSHYDWVYDETAHSRGRFPPWQPGREKE
jgi:hypothetical protein